jgi:hypothetical protein
MSTKSEAPAEEGTPTHVTRFDSTRVPATDYRPVWVGNLADDVTIEGQHSGAGRRRDSRCHAGRCARHPRQGPRHRLTGLSCFRTLPRVRQLRNTG